MVIRYDYGKKEVDACLSVLVELMTILGEFRDNIVLAGGWIPYFLTEENRHEHVGSLDAAPNSASGLPIPLCLADNALVALTLLIAESRAEEKDTIVKVVANLINQNN